jgi:alpha-beta hydrolase superfamily lysophospholipase
MMPKHVAVLAALFVLLLAAPAVASRRLDFPVRGRTLALTIYQPPATPQGTVIMGSGDVGWVGLGASLADDLSAHGYIVVGVNIRQYLSTFTDGKNHLTATDVPQDFRALRELLGREHLLQRPLIVAGVSEGAAIAVLAAADKTNHDWIDGVLTMGLPPSAELAWRWTDAASWVTRHDADEPSFAPHDFIAGIAPLPLVMIQSTKDEYVSEADYKRFLATAREPKKLVLIDASNHRFTDRRDQLRTACFAGLVWIASARRPAGAA